MTDVPVTVPARVPITDLCAAASRERTAAAAAGPRLRRSTRSARRFPATQRRGSLLTEMIVVTVIVSVVATVLLPALRSIAQVQRATTFESHALIEVDNLHQRLLVAGAASADTLQPGSWFRDRYPQSVLTVERVATDSPPPADQLAALRLSLQRIPSAERAESTVSVVVWVPADEESTE